MKTEYIYIFLGAMLLVNLFLLIKLTSGKKRQVSNKRENSEEVFQKEAVYQDNLRSDKTEVVSTTPKKASVRTSGNEIKIPAIPKLEDMDKTAFQGAVISTKKNNYNDNDATEVEGAIPRPSVVEKVIVEEEEVFYGSIHYSEEGIEKEFKICTDLLNIGRDPKYCELVFVEDKFVGRNHALIYSKNSELYFVDLNSKNGSFLNNQRISGQIKIENDTVIKIAHTEVLIKVGV